MAIILALSVDVTYRFENTQSAPSQPQAPPWGFQAESSTYPEAGTQVAPVKVQRDCLSVTLTQMVCFKNCINKLVDPKTIIFKYHILSLGLCIVNCLLYRLSKLPE